MTATTRTQLGAVLLALSLPLASLSAQRPAARIDGKWSGETSQGKAIALQVANARIVVLGLDWSLPLKEVCPSSPGSSTGLTSAGGQETFYFYPNDPGNEPPAVTAATFSLTKGLGGSANVTMVLAGRFASDTAVTGTIALNAVTCTGNAQLTWRASKTPED